MYDAEPDNSARLSELMQEMQETGQPPSEIVKDLAPGRISSLDVLAWLRLVTVDCCCFCSKGLQFDDEGMPVMPNMVRPSHASLRSSSVAFSYLEHI